MVDEKLYISGGSRNGRHLTDVQVYAMAINYLILEFVAGHLTLEFADF